MLKSIALYAFFAYWSRLHGAASVSALDSTQEMTSKLKAIPPGCEIVKLNSNVSAISNSNSKLKFAHRTGIDQFVLYKIFKPVTKTYLVKNNYINFMKCDIILSYIFTRSKGARLSVLADAVSGDTELWLKFDFTGLITAHLNFTCNDKEKTLLYGVKVKYKDLKFRTLLDLRILGCNKKQKAKNRRKCNRLTTGQMLRKLISGKNAMKKAFFRAVRSIKATKVIIDSKAEVEVVETRYKSFIERALKTLSWFHLLIKGKQNNDQLSNDMISKIATDRINRFVEKKLEKYFGNTCYKPKFKWPFFGKH